MTIENNIFKYATSELSQDAFLCYLMSFGKSKYKDANTEEYKLARSFLKELSVEEDIKEIKRQESHIDVLILTESYAVILEDKTFSKEHSEQLKRYKEKCKKDYPNKEVKLLYFKTGYMDIQEKEKFEEKGVCIFDIEKIINLVDDYKGDNIVVKMWKEHIEKINKDIAEAKETIEDVEQLDTYYKLSNEDTLKKDVYIDKLTKRFKETFNDVYWYRAGQGRTPHICFQDTYFKCSCSERCKIHFGIYIMFRNEPQIVVKQHFYTIPENHRLRLREYHKYSEELKSLQEMKHKFQQSIPSSEGWEKRNENKDKLIILEKKVSNMNECIENIKKLQEIIKNIGTPIDNPS